MGELTAQQVKNAQPRERNYYLSDGDGLLLEVRPNGTKYWLCRVRVHKKETRRGIGRFPDISLKEARELAHEKKANPTQTMRKRSLAGAFAELAAAFMAQARYAQLTLTRHEKLLRCHILPAIGNLAVDEITEDDVADVCDKILRAHKYNTAIKAKGLMSKIFMFAKMKRIIRHNPAADVIIDTTGYEEKHYATVTGAKNIGGLMRAILGYPNFIVRNALLLDAYTFCRPSEIANAEWSEIDLERNEWIIPAARMKLRQPHFVPLSRQVSALLAELKARQNGRFVFYSARTKEKAISPEALRVALRIMGYTAEDMTTHGFRAMASTVLNEFNWHADVIELQLAHGEHNAVRGAYNRAQHIEERKAMLQWYADYLDAVRDGLPVPPKPTITITL